MLFRWFSVTGTAASKHKTNIERSIASRESRLVDSVNKAKAYNLDIRQNIFQKDLKMYKTSIKIVMNKMYGGWGIAPLSYDVIGFCKLFI